MLLPSQIMLTFDTITFQTNSSNIIKSAKEYSLKTVIAFALSFIVLTSCSLSAQPNPYEKPPPDSTQVHREIKPARELWEEVAYFPGRLVYLPLKFTLKGAGKLVGYIDDTKIIQKIDDKLESDDGRRRLQFKYDSHTGGGAKYYENGLFLPFLDQNIATMTAKVGINSEQYYQATFEELYFANDLLATDYSVRYQRLTDESFYGLSMDSRYSHETTFTLEQTTIDANCDYNLSNSKQLSAVFGYEHTNIANGYDSDAPMTLDWYSEQTLPGIKSIIAMMYTGLELTYDTKDRPGNPRDGYDASLHGTIYQQINANEFGFFKYGFDVNRYLHLFYDRVLVVRMAAEINNPFKSKQIPFYYLSEMGPAETIRGFENGRFRDNDMFLTTVEYRYPVWRNWHEKGLDMILFADAGQVSSNILSYGRINNFELGYGFGFRLWDWKDGLVAKLQIGWGDHGIRLNLGLN